MAKMAEMNFLVYGRKKLEATKTLHTIRVIVGKVGKYLK